MARLLFIILTILLAPTKWCAAQEPQGRERVIAIALSLVGTTEATGKNDGPVIEAILRSAGASKGDPYCAAFNFYCYQQAGFGRLVPRSAWSPDWVKNPTWTATRGGKTPLPGDAGGIYFPSKGRIAHTFLIERWGTAVWTVEGNTSPQAAPGTAADRDGGGIWRKRRLRTQIFAVRSWFRSGE